MYYCMYCWLCMVKESIESLIHLGRCFFFFSFYRVKGGDWSETNVFRSMMYVIKTFVSFHV